MKPLNTHRPMAWAVLILMSVLVLLPTQELPAQVKGCAAVDRYGLPRECTFLEEHGACLWNALDSHGSCKDAADGFVDHLACEVGVQVDLLACNLGLPWRLLRTIIT